MSVPQDWIGQETITFCIDDNQSRSIAEDSVLVNVFGGIIDLQVVDHQGSGLENVDIDILRSDTLFADFTTNSNGIIDPILPFDEYSLNANLPGHFNFYQVDCNLIVPNNLELMIELGIIGNLNVDGDIDFDDLVLFCDSWQQSECVIELGPTSGVLPFLTVLSDRIVDFEDLMVFTLMWNYWHTNNPTYLVNINWPSTTCGNAIASIEYLDDGLFDLKINSEHNIKSCRFVLDYNPTLLNYEEISYSSNQNLIKFSILDTENGIIEFDHANLLNKGICGSIQVSLSFNLKQDDIGEINYFYEIYDDVEYSVGRGTIHSNNVPVITSLKANYPNPFNPETTICYSLSKESMVEIIVFNLKGQKVKSLISETKQPGKYKIIWNGRNENDQSVSSGIYFYRMRTKEYTEMRKMLLLK